MARVVAIEPQPADDAGHEGHLHVARKLAAHERELLELLVAADLPLPLALLSELLGEGADETLGTLARSGLVDVADDEVLVAPGFAAAARALVGAARAAVWSTLVRFGERMLAAEPGDPDALVLACRALTHQGEPRRSLELLQRRQQARAAVTPEVLARTLREIGATEPQLAAECQIFLAREQLGVHDFEAARRTLEPLTIDELPSRLACRARVLRAEALIRCGDPGGALLELTQARSLATGAARFQVEAAHAELSVLRGDLPSARLALRRLRAFGLKHPHIQARRALTLGLSYLFEDRPHRALACVRRTRLAQRRSRGKAVDPLVLLLEVAALMALDRGDRASAVIAQAVSAERRTAQLSESLVPIFHGGVLYRRGSFTEALRIGESVYRALDRRSDRVLLAFAAHFLARCALGTGQLALAETHLRVAAGLADEPGFAVLRPICELDFALLYELRGARELALEHLDNALGGPVQSPLARIERWALSREGGPPPRAGCDAVDAYGALRAAERALETGHLAECEKATLRAEAWYRRVGAAYELTRARVARAEALARDRRLPEAREVLEPSIAAAERNGYRMVAIAARLVEGFIADQSGELDAYVAAMRAAIAHATPELTDRSLVSAAARAGLTVGEPTSDAQPWRAHVERLGLARPGTVALERGALRWLLAPGELPAGAEPPELTVALDTGEVLTRTGALKVPVQRLLLLAALARAGRSGATLEQLYLIVWGGTQYHPLRHRNAVYVGLNRLRESLAGVLGGRDPIEVEGGLCRLVPELRIAVRDEARKTK